MSEVETQNAVIHEEKEEKCDEKPVKHENDDTEKEEKPVEHEKEESKEESTQPEQESIVEDSMIADSSVNAEKSEGASAGDDEKSDSDSEESLPPGLLERPVEILENKRQRKKITRFSYDDEKPSPRVENKKNFEVPNGSGVRLGDHPRVEYQLQRNTAEDLKIIHKFFYGFIGNILSCKKNLREFRGFDFKKDSEEYQKKEEIIGKFTVDNLRWAMMVCDVPMVKGIKDNLIDSFMEWCLCPKPQDKPLPEKRKKKDPEQKKKKKRTKKNGTKRSAKSIENGNATSDGVTPVKKPRKKKESDGKSPKKSAKTAKIKISSPKPKQKIDSSGDESSDEEPLLQKRKSPPSNAEIRKYVENLLKDADLEVLTMKVVFTQVYEQFPEFDLSDRKAFIKETVKKIIS